MKKIHWEKFLSLAINEYVRNNPPPHPKCEFEVYRAYVCRMIYFVNHLFKDTNGLSAPERNEKYYPCDGDIHQRLELIRQDISYARYLSETPNRKNMKEIEKLMKKFPEDEAFRDMYSRMLIHNNLYLEAEEILDSVERDFKDKPPHNILLSRLGIYLQRDFDVDKAVQVADKVILHYPRSFDGFVMKAHALLWAGDATGSNHFLSQAKKLDKKRFELFMKEFWGPPPADLMEFRFYQTLNEIMVNMTSKNSKDRLKVLIERAKRFCPNDLTAKMFVLQMSFESEIEDNNIEKGTLLVQEMICLKCNDPATLYCEALLAFRKHDMQTGLEKALLSDKMARKSKARYFVPVLRLLKDFFSAKGDADKAAELERDIEKAIQYEASHLKMPKTEFVRPWDV